MKAKSQSLNPVLHPIKYTENYERTRLLVYSSYILKARDRINQIQEQANSPKNDAFWSQIETILSRHEAQMDRAAQQAAELRENLSSSRKSTSSSHSERKNKANIKLKSIQKQIAQCNQQIQAIKSTSYQTIENDINSKIESTNTEIEKLKFNVKNLRKRTNELKAQLENKKKEIETRSSTINQTKNELMMKDGQLTDSINTITQKISRADAEIAELEQREAICSSLFESLKRPIPSIQRIFTNES